MTRLKKLISMATVSLLLTACATPDGEKHAHDGGGAPAGDTGKRMAMMQDSMLRMHDQMHRIREARDPDERARLMTEHRESMRQHMKMMHGGDSGMMGGSMMGAPAAK
jgi:hypothetical protein